MACSSRESGGEGLLGATGGSGGSATSGGSAVCAPGELNTCVCPTGGPGTHACDTATLSWTECVCGGAGGTGGEPVPPIACADTCPTAMNGVCEDGSAAGIPATCQYGTDCADCGPSTAGSGGSVGLGGTGGLGGNAAVGGIGGVVLLGGSGGIAGSGGVVLLGGSGGLGGSSGSGGFPSCGVPNPLLTPSDGYILDVDATGIMGAWYTFGCQGSTFTPAEGGAVLGTAAGICFSGTVPQVINDDYSTYFGAAVGFDLCGMPADTSFLPAPMNTWTAESKHTAGECGISLNSIAFDIVGVIPPEMRVVFVESGRAESTFLTVPGAGCFSGQVSSAYISYDPTASPINIANVQSVHFLVATNTLAPIPFDFCISDLSIN